MHDINQVVKWYGMKIKIKKTKVMKIGRQPGQVIITVDGQVLDQVEQVRHLGSLLSGDGYCVKEIKARIAMAKEALNKQKRLFTGGLRGELKKGLGKALVWRMRRELDLEKIKWTEKVKNEVLGRVNERGNNKNPDETVNRPLIPSWQPVDGRDRG